MKKRTHLRTAALVVAGIVLALLGILAYVHTPASEVGSATLRTIHLKGESVRISVADTDDQRRSANPGGNHAVIKNNQNNQHRADNY